MWIACHMGTHYVSLLLYFPPSSLSVAWESSRGLLKALEPCTRVGDLEEDYFSWLWIGSAPVIVAIWEVNYWIEDLSVSSFSKSAFQLKVNEYYIFLKSMKHPGLGEKEKHRE